MDFHSLPTWANLAIFAAGAALVWAAGTRLAGYADAIGRRTGLSRAFLGAVLLGVASSLPEAATTVTAALIGNARLLAGNLFGGVALQMAILAIVDLIAVRGALTYFAPQPVLLFQGVMLMLLLGVAMAGAALGEPLGVLGVGLTPILLVAGYLVTVRMSFGSDYLPRWQATNEPERRQPLHEDAAAEVHEGSKGRLVALTATSGLIILVAGWALAQTADALAEQTGLGASFVGVALLAGGTSLPELSMSLAAVRQGNHQMAVSNILGTNCLEMALFFLADVTYRGGPVLAETDQSALFAATIGLIVTCVFLLGLLERRDQTVLRMGIDSAIVLVVYLSGLGGLYYLRG